MTSVVPLAAADEIDTLEQGSYIESRLQNLDPPYPQRLQPMHPFPILLIFRIHLAYSLATEVHITHTSLVGLALRTDLAERIIGAAIVTITVEEGHELVELPLALVREVLQRRRRRCRRRRGRRPVPRVLTRTAIERAQGLRASYDWSRAVCALRERPRQCGCQRRIM